jgi:hypothetical protein
MLSLLCILAVAVLFASRVVPADADLVIYEISGVLPAGASSHSQISDGESWLATFRVDLSVTDSNPSENLGNYQSAAVAGSIEFSGGFSQALPPLTVVVSDDFPFNGIFLDAVVVRSESTSNIFEVTQETITSPNPLLSSDALPGIGTSFSTQPGVNNFLMLRFTDSITGEQVA